MLALAIGADGLKTGHTEEAGYGLVASAERDGRRIVLVVAGLDSVQQRSHEAERLINWAFRAFETKTVFQQGQKVAKARVWIGAIDQVDLAVAENVIVTVPFGLLDQAVITAHFEDPVEAPIEVGAELGKLEIALPDVTPISVPLVAVERVERGGLMARAHAAAELLQRKIMKSATE